MWVGGQVSSEPAIQGKPGRSGRFRDACRLGLRPSRYRHFQNANSRFVAVPSPATGPPRLMAHFRSCFAKSERDPGAIGLPVFIAVISSAELLGMVSATGSLTALAISSRVTSPLERKRLMTTFTLPGGKLYCSNLST